MNRNERRIKLKSELQPLIGALMKSPVILSIIDGKASSEFVWHVFMQYRFYCARFPQFLGALLARTAEPIARQPLVENLWEESGSGDSAKSHVAMLDTFLLAWARAIGKNQSEFESWLQPREAVDSFVTEVLALLNSESLPFAFGFLGPGTEEVTTEQYTRLLEGLRGYHLVEESDLEFFAAHIIADIKHADTFWNALEQVSKSDADWNDVAAGAKKSLERETMFWNELAGLK